jgi:hypothetical protein
VIISVTSCQSIEGNADANRLQNIPSALLAGFSGSWLGFANSWQEFSCNAVQKISSTK